MERSSNSLPTTSAGQRLPAVSVTLVAQEEEPMVEQEEESE